MSLNRDTTSPHPLQPVQRQSSNLRESEPLRGHEGVSLDDGISDKSPKSSTKKRLSGLTDKTKAKTKKLFGVDDTALINESESDEDGVFDSIEHNAAFQTDALVKKKRFRPGKTADKTKNNIKSLGKAIVHPVDSIKSKATRTTAGQLSKAERPFISQDADREYLEAHDNLKRAESTSSSKQGTSDEEQDFIVGGHREKLKEIEEHRESLQAAWTTSRHVRRVRVVPKRHIGFPNIEHLTEKDEHGGIRRYDWLQWLGHVREYVHVLSSPCAHMVMIGSPLPHPRFQRSIC